MFLLQFQKINVVAANNLYSILISFLLTNKRTIYLIFKYYIDNSLASLIDLDIDSVASSMDNYFNTLFI